MRQIQVTVCREQDLGQPDKTFVVHSHLGEILKHNDTVCGYDLNAINMADVEDFDSKARNMPDVVLVRKIYPKVRKALKTRYWKLKRFENVQEEGDDIEMTDGATAKKPKLTKKEKNLQARKDRDYNEFLQDLDEDPEMRQQIDLYKDHDVIAQLEKQIAGLDLNENPTTTANNDD
jgi:nonsense-mediated mRNA decay protein 3